MENEDDIQDDMPDAPNQIVYEHAANAPARINDNVMRDNHANLADEDEIIDGDHDNYDDLPDAEEN